MTATVIPFPVPVTRCQNCGAALSPEVTLTITGAGAYCTNRAACVKRMTAGA